MVQTAPLPFDIQDHPHHHPPSSTTSSISPPSGCADGPEQPERISFPTRTKGLFLFFRFWLFGFFALIGRFSFAFLVSLTRPRSVIQTTLFSLCFLDSFGRFLFAFFLFPPLPHQPHLSAPSAELVVLRPRSEHAPCS